MARKQILFVCSACGQEHVRWQGQCDSCQEWNSLTRFSAGGTTTMSLAPSSSREGAATIQRLDHLDKEPPRLSTGLGEFDRVCGGGLVPGSVVLLGGEPGVGKSTLLIKVLSALEQKHDTVRPQNKEAGEANPSALYICGEESPRQVQSRAARLSLPQDSLSLTADKELHAIGAALENHHFSVVAVDSIQTVWRDDIDSEPGSVMQIRAATQFWTETARKNNTIVIIIGHVTKDGGIAGPKLMEHMVDVVLSFVSEPGHDFRLLRALKNRFGSSHEVGVFSMTNQGLEEVTNPSALFLSSDRAASPGNAIYAGMAGTRPIMLEVQALVASSALPQPRRSCVGFDPNRLAMILAVLERYLKLRFSGRDVYLNVTGGYRLNEPAADAAVAAALLSAWHQIIIPQTSLFFGEVGLGGEIRPVGHVEQRMTEASKLGFEAAFAPFPSKDNLEFDNTLQCHNVRQVFHLDHTLKQHHADPVAS